MKQRRANGPMCVEMGGVGTTLHMVSLRNTTLRADTPQITSSETTSQAKCRITMHLYTARAQPRKKLWVGATAPLRSPRNHTPRSPPGRGMGNMKTTQYRAGTSLRRHDKTRTGQTRRRTGPPARWGTPAVPRAPACPGARRCWSSTACRPRARDGGGEALDHRFT